MQRSVVSGRLGMARDWVNAEVSDADRAILFHSVRVGPIALRNRFVMSAMGTRFATADGVVTERQIAYYQRRAGGGLAAVVVEGTSVDPNGSTYRNKPRLYDPALASGLGRLTDTIRAAGSVPGIQIMHAGRHASPDSRSGPPVSPSGGTSRAHGDESRPLGRDEIQRIVERFGEGARRARDLGFEIIEIHAAHGYLIHDFLSPAINRRTDGFGGDRAGRARVLVEIVGAVRANAGSGVAIIVRLSCSEAVPGGLTIEDAEANAAYAERAGADAILVSNGSIDNIEWIVPPALMPFGLNVDAALRIKDRVGVPIGVVGRISTPQVAVDAVRRGADLLFVGRAALADPDFVNKIAEPECGPIRPCIACNECLAQHIRREPVICTVDPAAGRELEESKTGRAARPRKITVIGAGPAGAQFAVRAAERGHTVTVIDSRPRTGGKLWLAAEAPYKTVEMLALYASLDAEIARRGVRIELGAEDDIGTFVRGSAPEVVVIATGARPAAITDLPIRDGASIEQAEDLLARETWPQWQRVAIIGAGDTACDTAARLAATGSRVWLLARGDRLARGVEPVTSKLLRGYLRSLSVETLLRVRVTEVAPGYVEFTDAEGDSHRLDVDHVVYSRGVEPTGREIADQMPPNVETIVLGDAADVGNFQIAMRSAWLAANRV